MPPAALPVVTPTTKSSGPRRIAIALAGAVSLAVAMGIGRFAFTPLLPMMLHDGVIDLHAASWLASTNYLGYLAGALLCTFQPWIWARAPLRLPPVDGPLLIRAGLCATGLLALAMATPLTALWPVWRFAAGVASAIVFVYTSAWCQTELAQRGSAALGAAIFTGPGAGIVASGLFASVMVGWQWRASTAWAIHGVLALLLTAGVWRTFQSSRTTTNRAAPLAAAGPAPVTTWLTPTSPSSASAPLAAAGAAPVTTAAAAGADPGRGEIAWLTAAYGLAGFGYIITATFLPVIARIALPGSAAILDLFWPIFGAGVTVGALLATRLHVHGDLRRLLAGCYLVQAFGIATSLWSPSRAGFVVGSLLLGLPFTAITFFAMQEVRRLRPQALAAFTGLLTAMYGIGQILGPPLVALLLSTSHSAGEGFARALETAASALLVGAAIFWSMSRAYPMRPPTPAK